MKDLLVQGEEHSKSASLPRGRAVPKAGPGFQTARGMAMWGDGEEGHKERRILAIGRITVGDTWARNVSILTTLLIGRTDTIIPET